MILRGVDHVSTYLPADGRTITYDMVIFEVPAKPLTGATGKAIVDNGVMVLKVRLDLSRRTFGHYLLGIRSPGVEWSYYPLVVR